MPVSSCHPETFPHNMCHRRLCQKLVPNVIWGEHALRPRLRDGRGLDVRLISKTSRLILRSRYGVRNIGGEVHNFNQKNARNPLSFSSLGAIRAQINLSSFFYSFLLSLLHPSPYPRGTTEPGSQHRTPLCDRFMWTIPDCNRRVHVQPSTSSLIFPSRSSISKSLR